jgi:peroxiredoxin
MKIQVLCIAFLLSWSAGMAQMNPQGLNINDKAPQFKAKANDGSTQSLKKALKKGPVVLIFYRGQWCPYCNKQLKAIEDSFSLIKAIGGRVFAITPETAENVVKTVQKTKASFPVLSDSGLAIMTAYKVAFNVDDKTVEKYKGYGIEFDKANGVNGAVLPVPAVYIINKKGIITYRYFNQDYSKRPSVIDILAQLKAAAQN